MPFDALKLSEAIERVVVRGMSRKYYRVARGGMWYGGIATADCCGCNLKCVFCWSGAPRDNPDKIGNFYTPSQIYSALKNCALKQGYKQVRISGNEPTIGRDHLLKVLELVEGDGLFNFILETNGILIGNDKSYAQALSKFSTVHVRVSLKGTCEEEFSLLTGALREQFNLQLQALKNLLDYGVSCHPAVMLSFSDRESLERLRERLSEIDPALPDNVEEEYVFMYPHVVERLKRSSINPKIAYHPNRIPEELI
ncbi:MAG: radical SAM protein [Candidatus Nezhaarchaeota archaeon]|nr:radical SAM protein [Candidatus Nezhaarchaeota archaeon]MCX8141509.1 radical SAM protein [Candidatus Nezhaarchaeota archaeon]MDW8049776.1 radical SAM protein [Nitrososphaerota archaeon]